MASAITRYVRHSFRTSLAYLYASIFRSYGARYDLETDSHKYLAPPEQVSKSQTWFSSPAIESKA
jgi:hypothetical protein